MWSVSPGTSTHHPGSGPPVGADGSRDDGDNLLGPLLPRGGPGPMLLVDWPKSLVHRAVFRGYTASGTCNHSVLKSQLFPGCGQQPLNFSWAPICIERSGGGPSACV